MSHEELTKYISGAAMAVSDEPVSGLVAKLLTADYADNADEKKNNPSHPCTPRNPR